MDPNLLVLSLLGVFCLSQAQYVEENECTKANAKSCGECIHVGEKCGWCTDPEFLGQGELTSARCDKVYSLIRKRCNSIENPRGSLLITQNKDVTNRNKDTPEKFKPNEITQIQPQKLILNLRSGEVQKFTLKFKRVEDYPIDLYYLMDLSLSMKDDLENIKVQGMKLWYEMKSITSDFRIGFGTLMETPMEHQKPCSTDQKCTSLFSYKNVLNLTDQGEVFSRLVSQVQISSKLGSPNRGFDAIMQVAVCGEQIGWRKSGIRLLVIATDAGFHFAGDGKLGGIVLPNDGKCHLENDMYTMSHYYGYPSIAQTLSENNIQTIFAVTNKFQPDYKKLQSLIPKSVVGTLSSSSSNFTKLIIDTYNSLSSEVILENSKLPEGVSISYVSHCKNGVSKTGEEGRKCSNISSGDEMTFDVAITSKGCPSSKTETVKIKMQGFTEEVEVQLSFICECACHKTSTPNSERCHRGNGTFECGACRCNEGRIGLKCECSTDEVQTDDVDANCIMDYSTDICSNNGDCVCGTCECKKRENPEERYSGKYCECDNFNCDRSNNKLCGGHGHCECRMCICDTNYTGSACDCSMDTSTCLAKNGQICNGHGTCECGMCKCTDPKFQGATCEICPTCSGVCTKNKECVQCRAFQTGEKKETCERDCMYFQLEMVETRGELPQPGAEPFISHCKERDANDCWFYYALKNDASKVVTVVKVPDCPGGGGYRYTHTQE